MTDHTNARCSFCGKPEADVEQIIYGPGVYVCNECVALCQLIIEGKPTPSFPSLDDKTDEQLLADAVNVDATRDQVDGVVRDRVALLRERGVTWERIGEALGMKRQSAWERFSK